VIFLEGDVVLTAAVASLVIEPGDFLFLLKTDGKHLYGEYRFRYEHRETSRYMLEPVPDTPEHRVQCHEAIRQMLALPGFRDPCELTINGDVGALIQALTAHGDAEVSQIDLKTGKVAVPN
jgi:hypothetical protein